MIKRIVTTVRNPLTEISLDAALRHDNTARVGMMISIPTDHRTEINARLSEIEKIMREIGPIAFQFARESNSARRREISDMLESVNGAIKSLGDYIDFH